jgi:hypothetical protein
MSVDAPPGGGKACIDGQREPPSAPVPPNLEVIDAHVHLFPPRVFEAIWRWFDAHAWPVRYRLYSEQVVEFLLGRGIRRIVALHYAHKEGMARSLNRYVAELARSYPEVVPLATVLPGEPEAREVLREALGSLGLRGVKIHCHVQRMSPDDPRLEEVYHECEAAGVPVVIHAGREPAFPAYGIDVRSLCSAERVRGVLERHPRLRVVVPHFGADEFEAYEDLLGRHENLFLDTTMYCAGFFPREPSLDLFHRHPQRILYGTDFPNIPFAWDRELRRLAAAPLDEGARRLLFAGNARRVFEID